MITSSSVTALVTLGVSAIGFTVIFAVMIAPPSVTNAVTDEDVIAMSGLVITPNPVDGIEVTHYQITNITNGTLS